jgi:hypothetical protein
MRAKAVIQLQARRRLRCPKQTKGQTGGAGASGVGRYHGHERFDTFSKVRRLSEQGRRRKCSSSHIVSGLSRRLTDFMIELRLCWAIGPAQNVAVTGERMIRDHGKVS